MDRDIGDDFFYLSLTTTALDDFSRIPGSLALTVHIGLVLSCQ